MQYLQAGSRGSMASVVTGLLLSGCLASTAHANPQQQLQGVVPGSSSHPGALAAASGAMARFSADSGSMAAGIHVYDHQDTSGRKLLGKRGWKGGNSASKKEKKAAMRLLH